ncbi:MAG: rhomboid family intramembrane serine protease [Candidatus Aenigmarchaeota archaeon]|nr:rhomboid family intramembrane serine protease [Candidatus Aenigmarchaeota archaeon]
MRATTFLIAAAIAAFIYTFFLADPDFVLDAYGFSGVNFVKAPYVLITSIFLHASLQHLLANVLVWLFAGSAVESEVGALRMTLLFFLGAFAGHVFSLLFYGPGVVGVGASAGIFALLGAGMLLRPLDLSFYPLVVPIPLAMLGLGYALYNVYGFIFNLEPNVSYVGHFGGLFVGLFYGFSKKGIAEGMRIIFITLAVMLLIPLLWILVKGYFRF